VLSIPHECSLPRATIHASQQLCVVVAKLGVFAFDFRFQNNQQASPTVAWCTSIRNHVPLGLHGASLGRRLLAGRSVADTAITSYPNSWVVTKGGTFTDAGQSYRTGSMPHTADSRLKQPPSQRCLYHRLTRPSDSPLTLFSCWWCATAHECLIGMWLFAHRRDAGPHSDDPVYQDFGLKNPQPFRRLSPGLPTMKTGPSSLAPSALLTKTIANSKARRDARRWRCADPGKWNQEARDHEE